MNKAVLRSRCIDNTLVLHCQLRFWRLKTNVAPRYRNLSRIIYLQWFRRDLCSYDQRIANKVLATVYLLNHSCVEKVKVHIDLKLESNERHSKNPWHWISTVQEYASECVVSKYIQMVYDIIIHAELNNARIRYSPFSNQASYYIDDRSTAVAEIYSTQFLRRPRSSSL